MGNDDFANEKYILLKMTFRNKFYKMLKYNLFERLFIQFKLYTVIFFNF